MSRPAFGRVALLLKFYLAPVAYKEDSGKFIRHVRSTTMLQVRTQQVLLAFLPVGPLFDC